MNLKLYTAVMTSVQTSVGDENSGVKSHLTEGDPETLEFSYGWPSVSVARPTHQLVDYMQAVGIVDFDSHTLTTDDTWQ